MILRDRELRALCEAGAIEPFSERYLQPASVDLRLGPKFLVPVDREVTHIDLGYVREETEEVVAVQGYTLHPGEFVLGSTAEWIRVPVNHVGRMEGKSSLGRLGLIVHVTAGFFDPGFEGRGTLEFVNLRRVPIILRPTLPICQFSFEELSGPADEPYHGRYQGDDGPEASRYGR